MDVIDSTANGLTLFSGTLGGDLRTVKVSPNGDFYKSAHPTEYGSLNTGEIMKALLDANSPVIRAPITGG